MSNDLLKLFGNNVRKERIKRGISQERLAEQAGLHRTYIGMIERAEKNVTLLSMSKIAKAFKMLIMDLLKGL